MPPPPLPASLVFLHATGFPSKCYLPFLSALSTALSNAPVFYPDPFLGNSPPFRPDGTWDPLVQQALQIVDTASSSPSSNGRVTLVGHSMGGMVALAAAALRPSVVETVVVLDPPYFSWRRRLAFRVLREFHLLDRLSPVSVAAAKRRDAFPSRSDAAVQWSKRSLFKSFDPECFNLYVEHGLVDLPDNKGVTLAIPKDLEKAVFDSVQTRDPTAAEAAVKGFYVFSAQRGTTSEADLQENRRYFPGLTFVEEPGSHLFPLEKPLRTAERVASLINSSKGKR